MISWNHVNGGQFFSIFMSASEVVTKTEHGFGILMTCVFFAGVPTGPDEAVAHAGPQQRHQAARYAGLRGRLQQVGELGCSVCALVSWSCFSLEDLQVINIVLIYQQGVFLFISVAAVCILALNVVSWLKRVLVHWESFWKCLHRVSDDWPEWQREPLDNIPGDGGPRDGSQRSHPTQVRQRPWVLGVHTGSSSKMCYSS